MPHNKTSLGYLVDDSIPGHCRFGVYHTGASNRDRVMVFVSGSVFNRFGRSNNKNQLGPITTAHALGYKSVIVVPLFSVLSKSNEINGSSGGSYPGATSEGATEIMAAACMIPNSDIFISAGKDSHRFRRWLSAFVISFGSASECGSDRMVYLHGYDPNNPGPALSMPTKKDSKFLIDMDALDVRANSSDCKSMLKNLISSEAPSIKHWSEIISWERRMACQPEWPINAARNLLNQYLMHP